MEFANVWGSFFSELASAMAIMSVLTTLWLAHAAALWIRRATRNENSAEHKPSCGAQKRCACRCACESTSYDADHSRTTADPV